MNPFILYPVMGKLLDRLVSLALVRQLVYEKENSELKPVKLPLKLDLKSHHARADSKEFFDSRTTRTYRPTLLVNPRDDI